MTNKPLGRRVLSKLARSVAPELSDSRLLVSGRMAEVERQPKVALEEKHTLGCQVLPTRQDLLRKIPKGGVACEVGVSKGEFSRDILDLAQPSKLHLIDAWDSERFAPGLEQVHRTLAKEIADDKVQIHQGLSLDMLERFPDRSFDFIYIDTTHAYDLTAAELKLSAKKIRPDGIIAGHDFCTGNVVTPVVYGVVEACREFCVQENWCFHFLTLDAGGHFSFALKKI